MSIALVEKVVKMDCHHKLPWTNEPAEQAGSKLEAGSEFFSGRGTSTCRTCCPVVSLSVSCLLLLLTCLTLTVLYSSQRVGSPRWRNLVLDCQNISQDLSLIEQHMELKCNNEELTPRGHLLDKLRKQLNETSAELDVTRLAFTSERTRLMEQVLNQTAANLQLTQEHEALAQKVLRQQEENRNKSMTIEELVHTSARLQEVQRNLREERERLRDEMVNKNREVLVMNDKLQREIQKIKDDATSISIKIAEEQVRNQNLSLLLVKAAEQEESQRKDSQKILEELQSSKEALRVLDLYCPVVNQRTNERLCKKCDDGWEFFQNHCYYFSSRTLPWNASRLWCQSQRGDLVIVNSQQEQMFIFNTSEALESGSRAWIGLTDGEVEGDWRWVDGSSLSSDLKCWLTRPGKAPEPDDWKQRDPLGEDCGHIDTIERVMESWMDASCQQEHRWICEKKIQIQLS
ncbi:CD209 antigen-like protein B isoform X1 [Synchiropus splendidus]|uniref:CD209 antigen-like protein B isoform X1 n=2 Tax=Synchiropus splendidus TaxID=270530 RepID=UPI00237E851E|nr:CD209 antigen-like protein B isoform X1 [Synchiropus splendidus]